MLGISNYRGFAMNNLVRLLILVRETCDKRSTTHKIRLCQLVVFASSSTNLFRNYRARYAMICRQQLPISVSPFAVTVQERRRMLIA